MSILIIIINISFHQLLNLLSESSVGFATTFGVAFLVIIIIPNKAPNAIIGTKIETNNIPVKDFFY